MTSLSELVALLLAILRVVRAIVCIIDFQAGKIILKVLKHSTKKGIFLFI